jgi:hypothetical protein
LKRKNQKGLGRGRYPNSGYGETTRKGQKGQIKRIRRKNQERPELADKTDTAKQPEKARNGR